MVRNIEKLSKTVAKLLFKYSVYEKTKMRHHYLKYIFETLKALLKTQILFLKN